MDFEIQEYEQRVERARALMAERDLDALMVTGDFSYSANYRYFAGYAPRDFQANTARPHVLLLTREGGAAISVHVFAETPSRACWVPEIHVYSQPFGTADVAVLFERLGVRSGRVGVELGLDQRMMMPIAAYEELKAKLPGCELVDASGLLWDLRMIKSPAEIECIRESDRRNGKALEACYARASIGMTEREVYDLCVHALIEQGSDQPPVGQMTIQSSARYRGKGMITFFAGPTDEPLGPGDVIFIDSGALTKGYWGEFNRMAVMGEPNAQQVDFHTRIRRVVRDSIAEVLRPGITCEQAMKEAVEIYDRHGIDRANLATYLDWPWLHLCHGLGMNSSEPPLVRYTDDTVIRPGMVFSVEAYVRGPDITYGSEEDCVITEDGAELLSEPEEGLAVIS
ncbi:MAG: M24 family metallopeptidase [Acidimicrobiia bacterium]